MRALHLKLGRELFRLKAQVLAIALVMAAGVATLLIGVGTYQSLESTRNAYYESNDFADLFAGLTRAPRRVLTQIAAIDGVLAVDGRVAKLSLLDIEGMTEPASALVIGLPQGEQPLNKLYLRQGRLPEPATNEIVISEIFAKANGFESGSTLGVVLNGRLRQMQVVGVALSPEYVYAVAPGELIPTEGRFGVIWLDDDMLAAAYDLRGAFNSVSVKLLPGASEEAVVSELDRLLEPYGGQGAYDRSRQTSNAFVDSELQQLQAMSQVLPPVFLLVAAFLVHVTLSRLITLDREQIGLLKALGYSSWAISMHYAQFALSIGVIGIVLGLAFGIWAGNAVTAIYTEFYSFPVLIFSRDPLVYAIACAITLAAPLAGAVRAVQGAAWLPPAVAMAPPAPPVYRKLLGGAEWLRLRLSTTATMVMRHLSHSPVRTSGGILGMSLSVAVLVGSLWTIGSMNFLIDYTFNRTERQDAALNFTAPKPLSAVSEVRRLPGVLSAEPFRIVGAELGSGHIVRRIAVDGRPSGTDLTRLLGADGARVELPQSGILLSRSLAKILGVGPGDQIVVDPINEPGGEFQVTVSALVDSYLGLGAYMELGALNERLGDGPVISGVNIAMDETRQAELFALLKRTPALGHLSMQAAALKQFRATMGQNLYIMVGVLVALASLIAFGVVYNFARISLSEQGRELASLRVLGFSRAEVSGLLLWEIALLALVAQPLGWAIGGGVAWLMSQGYSSELLTMPVVIDANVYAYSSLAVLAAALFSGLVVRRRIDRLDMIAVLKTRE